MPDTIETPHLATLAKAARRLRWLLPLFGITLASFTLLDRMGFGDPVHAPRAGLAVTLAVALAQLASGFLCVVVSAMWLHAASANLAARGERMHHSPIGAWGWYFLPVANLFMPLRAMKEIWAHSLGANGGSDPLLVRWWSAWIVGNIAMSMAVQIDALGEMRNGMNGKGMGLGLALDAMGVAALLVAGLLFARIVATVTRAQTGQSAIATFA